MINGFSCPQIIGKLMRKVVMNKKNDIYDQEANAFLELLGCRDEQMSRVAGKQILDMGTAGTELLLTFAKKASIQSRIRRNWVLFFTFVIIICLNHVFIWSGSPEWILIIKDVFVGGVGLLIAACMEVTYLQKRIALLLTSLDDVRAVGPLLEMLFYPGITYRRSAARALTRLFPQLRRDDTEFLTVLHREKIDRILNSSSFKLKRCGIEPDFIIALLKALQQIGDGFCLARVKDLAAGNSIAAKNIEIQKAAQSCLPYLMELSDERNSQALLRPSVPVSDNLLHPVASPEDISPSQLLRANIFEPASEIVSHTSTTRDVNGKLLQVNQADNMDAKHII